jgi:hypothetical protein
VDGTNGAVLGHFAQTALKNYNRATDRRRHDARISAEEDAMRHSIVKRGGFQPFRTWLTAFHFAMIEAGEHAERAHDVPILLDQTGVGIGNRV